MDEKQQDEEVHFIPSEMTRLERMVRAETLRQLELAWEAQRSLALSCLTTTSSSSSNNNNPSVVQTTNGTSAESSSSSSEEK